MPRYFFDVDYQKPNTDRVGDEFPDDDAAWHEATSVAAEMFRNLGGKFQPDSEWKREVTEEQRRPQYVIRITAEQVK
jgi:hypothetical protein